MVIAVGDSGHVAEHNAIETFMAAALALSSSTPAAVGTTGAVGTSTSAAHADHVHAGVTLETSATPAVPSKTTPGPGSASKASASDHKHPRHSRVPSEFGLLGFLESPTLVNGNGSALTSGVMFMAKIDMPDGGLIGHVDLNVNAINSGPVTGQNFVMVVNSSGTVIGASSATDGAAAFGTAGPRKVLVTAISGQSLTVTPGDFVYVVLLSNATTGPSMSRVGGDNRTNNYGLSAGAFITCQSGTSQTTVPTTITLSGTTSSTGYWAGVSV